jgi:hypothetical protein
VFDRVNRGPATRQRRSARTRDSAAFLNGGTAPAARHIEFLDRAACDCGGGIILEKVERATAGRAPAGPLNPKGRARLVPIRISLCKSRNLHASSWSPEARGSNGATRTECLF